MFGFAPARVVIFDTMVELSSAMGMCGFGVGFPEGGGGAVDFDGGGGVLVVGFEPGEFVDESGFACDDESVDLAAIVGWVFDGSVDGFVVDCCCNLSASLAGFGANSTLAFPAASVVPFVDSGEILSFFASISFTCSSIFDVVGVVGVGFASTGFSTAFALGAAAFAVFGVVGAPEAFVTVFFTGVAFADVDGTSFAVFVVVFVDLALVVAFFAVSGNSTSTGSEMTFFGLPLFFATSADIFYLELALWDVVLRSNAQRGNVEERGERFPENSWTRLGCLEDALC